MSNYQKTLNLFAANVQLMEKPGSSCRLEKCLRNTNGRLTFSVKTQVNDLHLFLNYHSSTSVSRTFCYCNLTTSVLSIWKTARKRVKTSTNQI